MLIGLHPQGSWSWRARPASLQNPLRVSAETHRLHTEPKSGCPCGQLPPHPSRSLKFTSNDLIISRPTLACEQTLQGGVTLPQNFSRFLSSGPCSCCVASPCLPQNARLPPHPPPHSACRPGPYAAARLLLDTCPLRLRPSVPLCSRLTLVIVTDFSLSPDTSQLCYIRSLNADPKPLF